MNDAAPGRSPSGAVVPAARRITARSGRDVGAHPPAARRVADPTAASDGAVVGVVVGGGRHEQHKRIAWAIVGFIKVAAWAAKHTIAVIERNIANVSAKIDALEAEGIGGQTVARWEQVLAGLAATRETASALAADLERVHDEAAAAAAWQAAKGDQVHEVIDRVGADNVANDTRYYS